MGLQLFRDRRRQDVAQQDVGSRARGFGDGLGLRELAKQYIPLQKLAAQLKLSHGLLGEAADGFTLRRADLVRLEVDHAQRPEGIAIPVDQRHAAVEAEVGLADDDRQILETRVPG
jgi:hypothetical protein